MRGESSDHAPFFILKAFLEALPVLTEESGDAAEALAALRVLAALGLDAGEIPGDVGEYAEATLIKAEEGKRDLILRVNRGIEASGL
jgi:hypothetical protein